MVDTLAGNREARKLLARNGPVTANAIFVVKRLASTSELRDDEPSTPRDPRSPAHPACRLNHSYQHHEGRIMVHPRLSLLFVSTLLAVSGLGLLLAQKPTAKKE